MKLHFATGTRNKQVIEAGKSLATIKKDPQVYNSFDFNMAIRILLKLYSTTRKNTILTL